MARSLPKKGQKEQIEREMKAVKDLLDDGQPRTFAEIRDALRMTDSVLQNRLGKLRKDDLVTLLPREDYGRSVYQKFVPLDEQPIPNDMEGYPDYYLQLGGWKCLPRVAA